MIAQKSSAFAAEKYEDHYQTALKQLVQEKLKGAKIVAPSEEPRPKGANVVDLMEALKRSVGGTSKATAPAKAPSKPKSSRSKKPA